MDASALSEKRLLRTLIRLLREGRKNKKLTQTQLADLLGFHGQVVSNWESGRCRPPAQCLVKLCDILELERSEIAAIFIASDTLKWQRCFRL